ncbi:MAG: aa3-type cytochrome c oxidase subunit IV [Caulobacteraceae bacterium]
MAEHAPTSPPGDMDIRQHEASFEGFVRLTKWGSLTVAVLLLFFTSWICTTAGFLGGLILALITLALGIFFLRDKPESAAGH